MVLKTAIAATDTDCSHMNPLATITVKSKLSLKPKIACKKRKCNYCPYHNKNERLADQIYFTKQNVTHQISTLICGIECKRCDKCYVG
jgi:hypothetical protein